VRGFGTALLHGGVQSIFAVMLLSLTDRRGKLDFGALLPALGTAWLLHAGFNQFVLPPVWQALAMLLVLPPVMMFVFDRSEAAVGAWLGTGFDADRDLLELLDSGGFRASPQGQYLEPCAAASGARWSATCCAPAPARGAGAARQGPADDARGRHRGAVDEDTRARFEEMRYLEGGRPDRPARAQALLHMSRRDLWQMYMLGK
jgi:hypothetical protein